MIKSMTGYGRALQVIDGMTVTVEIKSVNHRYFEFSAKVFRAYSFLEEKLKSYLQGKISRGKVECYVSIETTQVEEGVVQVNHSLAAGYYAAICELCEKYSLNMDHSVNILASHPDVFTVKKQEADEEEIWKRVKAVVDEALSHFIAMRETEGEKLKQDVLQRAAEILNAVSYIEERSPQTVLEYNEKLKSRIRELIGDTTVDEQRLLTEAALFADKIAVAEETVRLRSHMDQLNDLLNSELPVGRKIDFLVQEMNREANTIGSKACDLEIARKVIDIKSEIEKIREQIQNIE